jgi:hypothetical protein
VNGTAPSTTRTVGIVERDPVDDDENGPVGIVERASPAVDNRSPSPVAPAFLHSTSR